MRRRSRGARLLAIALIVLGALVLIDAVVTIVWQEPLSALYASFRQASLRSELRDVEVTAPSHEVQTILAGIPNEQRRIEFLAREMQADSHGGSPIGRIIIPKIHADFVVIDGTDTEDLEAGPGLYPETVFPGVPGTTAIAGHRTTFLAPFRHIDQLTPGSTIELNMPYAHFTFTVTGQKNVLPSDVAAATAPVGYTRLVLSACTPAFSAAERLLVYSRLTAVVPEGAARILPGGLVSRPIVLHPGAPRRHVRLKVVLKTGKPHGTPAGR